MRVFLTPLQHDGGPSEMRVVKALTDYAISGIDIVSDRKDADLVVLHVIGRQERISRLVDYLKTNNQRYVVIQYCLRSTQKPSTEGWFPIWQGAEFVWSYYNLRELCKEDGTSQDFAFYHAPLGVDANVFQASPESERPYVICTSGLSKAAESVAEAMRAARRVNRPVFHLGPDLKFGSNITYMTGIDDTTLAKMYSQCEFVSKEELNKNTKQALFTKTRNYLCSQFDAFCSRYALAKNSPRTD